MSRALFDQPDIEALGDTALVLRFGDRIDAALNLRVLAAAMALHAARLPGVRNLVPAYASLTLHYDPCAWIDRGADDAPYWRIAQRVRELLIDLPTANESERLPEIEIPICYGGEFGLDLEAVATHAQLDSHEIIARHTRGEYRVAMLGFSPGFPYLLGLDRTLHAPRRANPRIRVAAGSVAIGGAQTGIYPRELPGGWQLIGRTALPLFDPTRESPTLLAPGQRVRFRAISAEEFRSTAAVSVPR